eukprot:scaffold5720_cov127-Isochrysis_galbana.AAC.5
MAHPSSSPTVYGWRKHHDFSIALKLQLVTNTKPFARDDSGMPQSALTAIRQRATRTATIRMTRPATEPPIMNKSFHALTMMTALCEWLPNALFRVDMYG